VNASPTVSLPTVYGNAESLKEYGLTFYHAIDAIPAIFNKDR
jgi:Fe2+ or Zn2+ uptake regulation protein